MEHYLCVHLVNHPSYCTVDYFVGILDLVLDELESFCLEIVPGNCTLEVELEVVHNYWAVVAGNGVLVQDQIVVGKDHWISVHENKVLVVEIHHWVAVPGNGVFEGQEVLSVGNHCLVILPGNGTLVLVVAADSYCLASLAGTVVQVLPGHNPAWKASLCIHFPVTQCLDSLEMFSEVLMVDNYCFVVCFLHSSADPLAA